MNSLDDPAPGPGPMMAFGLRLLAPAAQVKLEAVLVGEGADQGIVVALIEASESADHWMIRVECRNGRTFLLRQADLKRRL